MVVGTGDLSELALGWATYNGDHMSMYGVNASMPKTLVAHHSALRGAKDAGEGELRDAAAGYSRHARSARNFCPLKDGEISQNTEDLVGPYELHDFFLYYALRCGLSARKGVPHGLSCALGR